MNPASFRATLSLALAVAVAVPAFASDTVNYAVVVSKKTQSEPAWAEVATVLVRKHDASLITFDSSVNETLPELRRQFPRFVCFVAQPEEATREYVRQIHRLTRRFDDDPYTDCFWGIVTGYEPAAALRIAGMDGPLTIRKAAAGTDIALDQCEEGRWYCELNKNRLVQKDPGKTVVELKGPDDTTAALAGLLNDYHADLFVTSGHATEHDWQIGYRYRNGSFRCKDGKLFGLDTTGHRTLIESTNPKVYMAVGNCLMGHIDGRESMALAFMNSGGVDQMFGYTVNTWYGYAGWGCLDYFVEQPGRFTFTEAFFANQHALIHRLATYFPELLDAEIDENARTDAKLVAGTKATAANLTAQDARGLLYDRDVLAFYGDPAWIVRMAKQDTAWTQSLIEQDGVWTFDITAQRGARTFDPINKNGAQRGGRPIIQYLPHRLGTAKVLEGAGLNPVITDDFILVPNPGKCDLVHYSYRVRFQAAKQE